MQLLRNNSDHSIGKHQFHFLSKRSPCYKYYYITLTITCGMLWITEISCISNQMISSWLVHQWIFFYHKTRHRLPYEASKNEQKHFQWDFTRAQWPDSDANGHYERINGTKTTLKNTRVRVRVSTCVCVSVCACACQRVLRCKTAVNTM